MEGGEGSTIVNSPTTFCPALVSFNFIRKDGTAVYVG